MKAIKKVLTLCLAAVLLLALCPAAFADTTSTTNATVTIADAKKGESYKIYRMFDVLSVDTNVDPAQISYKVTDAWANFFTEGAAGAGYITLTDGYPTWNEGKSVADFAKAAKTYAASTTATDTQTATAAGVTFTLPLGYYFVDSSLGAVCNLTSAHQDVTIHEKNGVPTVDKKILEGDVEKESNTAAIGDTVTYQSKVTLTQGTENVVYHDVMTEGLTFDSNSVKLDGAILPSSVTVKTGNGLTHSSCTFEVVFSQEYLNTLDINTTPNTSGSGELKQKTVTLTYNAIVNEKANVDDKDTNTAHLTYGNQGRSTEISTNTTYRSFDLIKYTTKNDQKGFLSGAKFSLYKTNACTVGEEIALIQVSDDSNGTVYRVATTNETGSVKEITTGEKLITIKGLDDITYYLKEIEAPKGYNPLTEPVDVDLTSGNLKATADGNFYQDKTGVQVENQAGTTLPSTGGMGTTVFYVVGGLLMAAAAVLLIAKKRMGKNA